MNEALLRAAQETPSLVLTDTEPGLDLDGLRHARLRRVREALQANGVDAALMFDPIQMRYATGFRCYAVFQMHIPSNYLLVTVDGPVVMFAVDQVQDCAAALDTIDEVRPAISLTPFGAGARLEANLEQVARMVSDVLGPARRRLAVGRAHVGLPETLQRCGVRVCDADLILERARSIKLPDEIRCMNASIGVAEEALFQLREAVRPGVCEFDLTAILGRVNTERGGDWLETRLLSSGDRINPWERESSGRRLRPGDLIAVDTDMVGPLGYCADLSRTFHCGPGRPTPEQRMLYDIAVHGIGMSDEWPCIFQSEDASQSYEGEVQPGMVLAVESYIGEVGGTDGVKLEEMVLVTDSATTQLTRFPYEAALLE